VRTLTFHVTGAEAMPFAATPTIAFQLRIANRAADEPIHSIALRARLQIEAQRRHYDDRERAGLRDLFGEPDRWSRTLRPLLWTDVAVTAPEFSSSVTVELPVACTFDFNVAATKYFSAVEDGDIPLNFQFSGTIFFPGADGVLQISQIGWDQEARYRLPVTVWRDMMDCYYPNSAWLRLRRDIFDRLHELKRQRGLATWEEAIESLLPAGMTRAAP
jgi:hypothetical protein